MYDKNKLVPNAMLAHNTFHSTVTCKSLTNSSNLSSRASIFYNKEGGGAGGRGKGKIDKGVKRYETTRFRSFQFAVLKLEFLLLM